MRIKTNDYELKEVLNNLENNKELGYIIKNIREDGNLIYNLSGKINKKKLAESTGFNIEKIRSDCDKLNKICENIFM